MQHPLWTADIVSLRSVCAEDVQVPLLYSDRLRIHDFGSIARYAQSNKEAFEGMSNGVEFGFDPQILKISRETEFLELGSGTQCTLILFIAACRVLLYNMHERKLRRFERRNPIYPRGELEGMANDLTAMGYEVPEIFTEYLIAQMQNPDREDAERKIAGLVEEIIDWGLKDLASSKPRLPIPIDIPDEFRVTTTRAKAALLSEAAISLAVPNFEVSDLDVVLELRTDLADELGAFRIAMLSLTTELDKLTDDGADLEQLEETAQNIIEFRVEPSLVAAERKLREIERRRHTKWLRVFARTVPLLAGTFATPTLKTVGGVVGGLLDGIDEDEGSRRENRSVRHDMGVGFLMKLRSGV